MLKFCVFQRFYAEVVMISENFNKTSRDKAFNRFFDTVYRYIFYINDVWYDFIDVKRIIKLFNLAP